MTRLSLVKNLTPLSIRLPNWVGDVCMALPTLNMLHELNMFDLRIHGKSWATDLLAGMPFNAQPISPKFREMVNTYTADGSKFGIVFPNSFSSALQMWLANVATTGYAKECRGRFLKQPLPPLYGIHEVESFWNLGYSLIKKIASDETPPKAPPPSLGLTLSPRHVSAASGALKSNGVKGEYVVLCPLAVGLIDGKSKVWPSFPLFCRTLVDQKITVVACPGPGEEDATAKALPGAVLLNDLGLGAYAAVLSGARCVVANDSGPMHLAAAVDARVIGVFGVSDPKRTRPWCARGAVAGSAISWPPVKSVVELVRAS